MISPFIVSFHLNNIFDHWISDTHASSCPLPSLLRSQKCKACFTSQVKSERFIISFSSEVRNSSWLSLSVEAEVKGIGTNVRLRLTEVHAGLVPGRRPAGLQNPLPPESVTGSSTPFPRKRNSAPSRLRLLCQQPFVFISVSKILVNIWKNNFLWQSSDLKGENKVKWNKEAGMNKGRHTPFSWAPTAKSNVAILIKLQLITAVLLECLKLSLKMLKLK